MSRRFRILCDKGGEEGVLGQVTGGRSLPYSKIIKSLFAVFKLNVNPKIFEIELAYINHFFPKTMGRSDLRGQAQF